MQIKIRNHFFFTRKRPTRKQLEAALRVKDDIISKLYKEIELRSFQRETEFVDTIEPVYRENGMYERTLINTKCTTCGEIFDRELLNPACLSFKYCPICGRKIFRRSIDDGKKIYKRERMNIYL